MIVDCISDLHGHYPELAGGDLLIVAGDLTATGEAWEMRQNFMTWIVRQNYKRKIFIAGNHDNRLYKDKPLGCPIEGIDYLCDSGTKVCHYQKLDPCNSIEDIYTVERQDFNVWGSPWTKRFEGMNPNCMAFTCETEEELAEKWDLIPEDTNILVTHSPPLGVFDINSSGKFCGSPSLRFKSRKLKELKLFVFGHIHEGYRMVTPKQLYDSAIPGIPIDCASIPYLVNASHVNERYQPVNKPIRVIL